MRFQIRHRTRYSYSGPVFLERQALNLRPPSNANQRLIDFDLAIDPAPAGQSTLVDLELNDTIATWFNAPTNHLEITATSIVDTLRPNPFDYLWDGPQSLPVTYSAAFAPALALYQDSGFSPQVEALAANYAREAGNDGQRFLSVEAEKLHERIVRIFRPEGEPWRPEETLDHGEGSCRDLTVLYMALARAQGFACRFVTGYHALEEAPEFDLHAWAEVYVPGGGWRGFDPTHGLAVADRHVSVAFGRRPDQAMTVTGSYRGAASSRLEADIEIRDLTMLPRA